MPLVRISSSFTKIALISHVAWFTTDVTDNLLLLDLVVCSFQLIVIFGLLMILLILSFEPVFV